MLALSGRIALIEPGRAEQVAAHVGRVFHAAFGVEAGFDLLRVGTGPVEV